MKDNQELKLIIEEVCKQEDGSSFIFRLFEPANTDHIKVIEICINASSSQEELTDAIQKLSLEPKLAAFPLWTKAPVIPTYSSFKRYIDRINQWASDVDHDALIHLTEEK